jgi:type 1 glutamine amidotransferase
MNNQSLSRGTKITLVLATLAVSALAAEAKPKQVLVVSVTKGFRHDVIPTTDKVVAELARKSGRFTVDYVKTEQDMAQKMTAAALKKYDAVIFNNTTGDLPLPDREGFLAWITSGKGFVGLHAATDTYRATETSPGFPGYVDMIGAEFKNHFEQVEVEVLIQDSKHPATRHFTGPLRVKDEIYLVKNFHREKVHGLLWLDKHPNFGAPGDYPIAWCKNYGKGRVFYTSLGHRTDVVERPDVQQHYLGGILWALGLEKGNATPQSTKLVLSAQEVREGFRPLFNGVDLLGWRLRNPAGPKSWSVQNGMLVNEVGKPVGPEHGTDLVTEEKFWNFTARFEYLMPKDSNSGFYLRGRHEIQLLDDGDSTRPTTSSNGAIYSFAAPFKFASRRAGEWQTLEATIIGNQITVVLNGVKIHDHVECNRTTGGELDGNVREPGPIFLQGDHGSIGFRNLRIKILK